MAIIAINEEWSGRDGDFNINAEHTLTRVFVATTDGDTTDTPALVKDSTLLPGFGALEPSGLTLARLKKKRVTQDPADKKVFRVTCEYDTKTEEEEDPNPVLRPLVVSGSFASYTREIDVDNEGKKLVNSANSPLIVEQEDNRLVLNVVRPVATVNVDLLADYRNAINSDSFQFNDNVQLYSFTPQTVLLASAPFSPVTEAGVTYYKVTMAFQINTDGWNPRKLFNLGLVYHDAEKKTVAFPNGILTNAKTVDGQVTNQPVRLNLKGQLLDKNADVIVLEFNTYEERPFAALFQ